VPIFVEKQDSWQLVLYLPTGGGYEIHASLRRKLKKERITVGVCFVIPRIKVFDSMIITRAEERKKKSKKEGLYLK
jgi:hypothetical protein